MISAGLRVLALAGLTLGIGGPTVPAYACPAPTIQVVRLSDLVVLAEAVADGFELIWRHSVTLTDVHASYAVGADGSLHQTEERFTDHGPGLAFDGDGWRIEDGAIVLSLDRFIDQLILRTAPEHRNRLKIGAHTIDLTYWPRQPLEILARPCTDTSP